MVKNNNHNNNYPHGDKTSSNKKIKKQKTIFLFRRPTFFEQIHIAKYLKSETTAGIILVISGITAVALANTSLSKFYYDATHFKITIPPLTLTTHQWVADGLLAIFFFVVGLELKYEFVLGTLQNFRVATIPIVSAIGGMIVPAGMYIAILFTTNTLTSETYQGWGIPIATDIAFALAILVIFGKGLPATIRAFLLTLAIVDDLGAILIIAFFYTDSIQLKYFFIALGMFVLWKIGMLFNIRSLFYYIPISLVAWWAMHESGIHATIVGVTLGLLTTINKKDGSNSIGVKLEEKIHPYSSIIILPLFALVAAGTSVTGTGIISLLTEPITLAILVSLAFGKPMGVFLGAKIAQRLTHAQQSHFIENRDILAIGFLAGIGFTVSMLIAELSFKSNEIYLNYAKVGILAGTILAIALSAITFLLSRRHFKLISEAYQKSTEK